MKLCSRCQTLKYPSQFRIDKNYKDGLKPLCKKCIKEMRDNPYRSRKRELKHQPINRKISDKSMCNILQYHKNVMDKDDERLHTQFIIDVINHQI
jgi:hypothetical protein